MLPNHGPVEYVSPLTVDGGREDLGKDDPGKDDGGSEAGRGWSAGVVSNDFNGPLPPLLRRE